MQKAILEITPEDPGKYFNLETNGLNKVQIADGIRACLHALDQDIYNEAVKAVGNGHSAINKWIHEQRAEHVKAQVINSKKS